MTTWLSSCRSKKGLGGMALALFVAVGACADIVGIRAPVPIEPGGTCSTEADCPVPVEECRVRTCTAEKTCGFANAPVGATCAGGSCDANGACKLGNGSPCSDGIQCFSGFCVDDVCCASECQGQCQACATDIKGPGTTNGVCGPVQKGVDPDGDCGAGTCSGTSACVGEPGAACSSNSDCNSQTCVDGVCCDNACTETCKACNVPGSEGICSPVPVGQDDATCTGMNESCDGSGVCKKEDGMTCGAADECLSGVCAGSTCSARSCIGLPQNCGPLQDENCCTSNVVEGGESFTRDEAGTLAANVSSFRLDRFEVTVGRFRKFVEAYPGSRPTAGAGAHPLIPLSGWDPAWDEALLLPMTRTLLEEAVMTCKQSNGTWTSTPGANENKPINCVSWYVAFAFCAWDGGRLPTEAEWGYAAAGGSEHRAYPWSNPTIDGTYAVYNSPEIQNVGSKSPKGDGRWSQADLAGNIREWVLDYHRDTYKSPCIDCAELMAGGTYDRVNRGGHWDNPLPDMLKTTHRNGAQPQTPTLVYGMRCARAE